MVSATAGRSPKGRMPRRRRWRQADEQAWNGERSCTNLPEHLLSGGSSKWADHGKTPARPRYSGSFLCEHLFLCERFGGSSPREIGFNLRAKLRGDLGPLPEPQFKSPHRLMQQHAEPIGGLQSARLCRRQQRCFEWHIDEIADHGPRRQTADIDVEG